MTGLGTEADTAEVRRRAAITHGYDYLAGIWLEGPHRLAEPALRAWLADLRQLEPTLAARCADLVRLLDNDDERAEAEEDFQCCLVIPQPGRYLPPYASVWLDGQQELWGPTTMRVLRCYAQAGLDWQRRTQGGERPWVRAPDHLGVECAFVAEQAAGPPPWQGSAPDRAGPAVLATSFVRDHLRTWVPAYAAQLGAEAVSRYWRNAAAVLADWVRQDSLLPAAEHRSAGPVIAPDDGSSLAWGGYVLSPASRLPASSAAAALRPARAASQVETGAAVRSEARAAIAASPRI